MKILFFGDVIGKAGREAVKQILPELRAEHKPDLVIANAENLAHGKGVTLRTLNFMIDAGVDFFTSGNHVFDKPEGKEVFKEHGDKIIRPYNLPDGLPGAGWKVLEVKGKKVLIANLLGQVFMEKQFDHGEVTNPFHKINEILAVVGDEVKVRLLDFHSEATSEKRGMGFWADGRMSAVFGTHTHVATSDAQILPLGTGYQTDVGMVGVQDSIIGVQKEVALARFQAGEDSKDKPALAVAEEGACEISYLVLEIDETTGKCKNINSFVKYL